MTYTHKPKVPILSNKKSCCTLRICNLLPKGTDMLRFLSLYFPHSLSCKRERKGEIPSSVRHMCECIAVSCSYVLDTVIQTNSKAEAREGVKGMEAFQLTPYIHPQPNLLRPAAYAAYPSSAHSHQYAEQNDLHAAVVLYCTLQH